MAIPCPTCGLVLIKPTPHAELVLADARTDEVSAAVRLVRGTCEACGPRFAQRSHIGHHDTTTEARLQRRYPKKGRSKLRGRLIPADQKRFAQALRGRVAVNDEDIQRWDAAAQSDIVS